MKSNIKTISPFSFQKQNEADIVVGRMYGHWGTALAGFVFIGLVTALWCFAPSNTSAMWGIVSLIALMGFGCCVFAWALIRCCVIADKDGLHWRGMFGRKSCAWPQVQNYYYSGGVNADFWVETAAGKVRLNNLTHLALLRQTIQERAQWSKSREWEEQNQKTNSNPISVETFKTECKSVSGDLFSVAVLAGLVFWYVCNIGLTKALQVTQSVLSLGPLLLLSVVAPCVVGLCLMIGGPIMQWPLTRACVARKNQSITLSDSGITWRDAATAQEIQANWEDITDFYVTDIPGWIKHPVLCVVETKRGTFDFLWGKPTATSGRSRLMLQIQQYCARHELRKQWRYRSDESKAVERKVRLYTHRNRVGAFSLLVIASVVLAVFLPTLFQYFGLLAPIPAGRGIPPAVDAALFLLSLGFLFWQCLGYGRCRVETGEPGLTIHTRFQKHFIAWPDILDYENRSGRVFVRGRDKCLSFSGPIMHWDDLKETITERAINSRTKMW